MHNTLKLELTLKKKCNTAAYHAIHKSMAMGESLTGYIRSEDNPADLLIKADLLTKVITGQKRNHFVSSVLYDIYVKDS